MGGDCWLALRGDCERVSGRGSIKIKTRYLDTTARAIPQWPAARCLGVAGEIGEGGRRVKGRKRKGLRRCKMRSGEKKEKIGNLVRREE